MADELRCSFLIKRVRKGQQIGKQKNGDQEQNASQTKARYCQALF
jgi:hypothetical protein